MRNVDEAGKTTARALRTFEGAPKGYWWIVGALVALASAAMLLHESGSWMLDLAPLWGASVNIRAFSCDAHSLGLVFGYAVTQINGRKFARLVGDGLFWLIFFIAQVGNVLLFYGCLTVLDAPFAIVTLRRGRPVDVSLIWNRFYRFVFPVVCVAALLGPLTNSSEFLPALIMQACALYYFDALLAMACSVIGQAINAAPSQVFGRAFLIRSIGFLLGNLVGSTVYERVVLDAAAFSVIGTAVFVLLVLVTFNMNSEKYAKTVWGLLPHEDPRGRYERTRDERCATLADRFGLTERETEVLRLLARNKRPRDISDVLVVSVATVRSHVHAIYTKTGVHSAAELVKLVECPQDKS